MQPPIVVYHSLACRRNISLDLDYDLGLGLGLDACFHLCSGHQAAAHHNVCKKLSVQDCDCDCDCDYVIAAARVFDPDLVGGGASHLYQKPCRTGQSGYDLQPCGIGVFVRDSIYHRSLLLAAFGL